MAYVDEVFKGQRKAILHDARRDEDAVRAAKLRIPMTDGAIGEIDGVAGGDGRLVLFAKRERHEVISAACKGIGNSRRYGLNNTLQVIRSDLRISKGREADAVFRLPDVRLLSYLGGRQQRNLGGFNHKEVF